MLEVVAMVGVYLTYDSLRDRAAGMGQVALEHARQIVSLEQTLGIYWEREVQRAFLRLDWFIAFWNIFYGTIHFVVPVIALVWLYRRAPARYSRWRTTLVVMFALAILSFWLYPLMPPRLMPARFGFVDTAARYYNFGPQVRVHFLANGQPTAASVRAFGNLFAAMPSFHVGWSTWSVLAIWPLVRRRWVRWILVAYPVAIVFCITVTANHWFLDAVGGLAVFAVSYLAAGVMLRGEARLWTSRDRRAAASGGRSGRSRPQDGSSHGAERLAHNETGDPETNAGAPKPVTASQRDG